MIDPAALLAHDFGETRHAWSERDAILYALGVGLGRDPLDMDDLRFLDERDLSVLPTYAVTLASPGMWIRDPRFGIDFGKLVHQAQSARFLRPLPPSGEIAGMARVKSLADRGAGKRAVVVVERTIADARDGSVYCSLEQTLLLRGDGGFGGDASEPSPRFDFAGEPHRRHQVETSPRAALIYRLSGDWNPLHLDPAFAKEAGFERPILQGLASYALAGVGVSRALGHDPATMALLACRFSGVIMPGDAVDLAIWPAGDDAHFQAFTGTRKVLDDGHVAWRKD